MLGDLFDPGHYAFNLLAVPHFATAFVVACTGLVILLLERGSRVSRMFGAFSLLFTLWIGGRGFVRLALDPDAVELFGRYLYLLVVIALPLLVQFIWILLRMEQQRARWIRVNWMLGIAMGFVSIGTPWVIGSVQQFSWGWEPQHGPAGYFIVGWISVLIVRVNLDLQRAYTATVKGSLEHRRVGLFAIAVVTLQTGIADFLTSSGVPIYPFAFVPVAGFTLLTAYMTWRYGLVEVTAQLAADEIARMIRTALLILDRDGIIQVINERTQRMFGLGRASLVGQSAGTLLGDAFAVPSLSRMSRLEWRDSEKELLYADPQTGSMRDLAFSVSSVHDAHGREVAYVCVVRDVTEQKRVQERRLSAVLTDTLTSLHSRAMFLGLLDAAVRHARESSEYGYAVCFLGLDRMRVINEDLGYPIGDQVLVEVANRLRQCARPGDAVARVGGDEFGVLIDGPVTAEQVRRIAQDIDQALRAPMALGDHNLYLSASIGIATSELGYGSGVDLLRNAGIAMYRAKERGGGVHLVAAGEVGSQRTRLESDLRRAVAGDELAVYYQPVIDLHARRVVGFEALVRWRHPERGLLLPAEFIEFAEEVGLVAAIDRLVLRRACAELPALQAAAGDRHLSVSVNVADSELLDGSLPDLVQSCLKSNDLLPGSLRLELLERVIQHGPVLDALRQLRGMGIGLYIDDFGTGYSSLSRLHELPITAVKVDREFVRAMSVGAGGEKIITSLIAVARTLDLDVIAEGASVAEEVRRLHELGCRHVQGFYFAEPLPYAAALELVGDANTIAQKCAALGR